MKISYLMQKHHKIAKQNNVKFKADIIIFLSKAQVFCKALFSFKAFTRQRNTAIVIDRMSFDK